MPKSNRWTARPEGDASVCDPTPGPVCQDCQAQDPQRRYGHVLTMARHADYDATHKHLALASGLRESTQQQLLDWVREQMTLWSGFADEFTGAPLPWYQARQQALAMGQAMPAPTPPDPGPATPAALKALLHRLYALFDRRAVELARGGRVRTIDEEEPPPVYRHGTLVGPVAAAPPTKPLLSAAAASALRLRLLSRPQATPSK